MRGIIFDLDQTIVNSSIASIARSKREWQSVYKLIPEFEVYEGIDVLINNLRENNIQVFIVTSSPKSYCTRVLDNFNIKVDGIVAYHDTKLHKPYSEPIDKAIKMMNIETTKVISIGDDDKDIIASKSAGTYAIGVTWGGSQSNFRGADKVFSNVIELEEFLNMICNKNILEYQK